MLLRSLHIASRQLFYLLVTTIIVGLIGLLLAVWLSEEIAKRKDELAVWVSEQSGYPVEIGGAGLYLFDLIPKLELTQLTVNQQDDNGAALTVEQVHFGLDLLATLRQQQPVLADARLQHVQMAVNRNEQGEFTLTGTKPSVATTSPSVSSVISKISWLQNLVLSDIEVVYSDNHQPNLAGTYQIQHAELDTSGPAWQFTASVDLPSELGQTIQLEAQASLDASGMLSDWRCQLESDTVQVASLLDAHSYHGLSIKQGSASVKAMLNYQHHNKQYEADLAVDLHALSLVSYADTSAEPVNVEQLTGHFSWQSKNAQWQLSGDNLRLQVAGDDWPLTQFKVSYAADGELQASADYLRLSDLTAVSLLIDDAPELIKQTRPAGDINRLQLRYSPATGLSYLTMRATEVALLPWQNYPGATNLSFSIDWHDEQRTVDFDSHKTTIYADTWLDEAVFLESLTGKLAWRQSEQNWQLTADALRLWNEDLSLQADGRIQQQQQQFDSDIKLTLQDVAVNRWKAYVPEKILPEDFKNWSANAFVNGQIVDGEITLQGDPTAFPFDKEPQRGQFDMALNVENMQLHYAPDWPDLIDVKGKISGQGNNLLITSRSGTIADIQFTDVTTKISNLVRPKPVLTVDGRLNGTSDQALAFLNKSPLKQRFGSLSEWLTTTGKSQINLQLTVPLTHVNDTQASGYVTFENSVLTTRAVPGLKVEAINGALNFNNNGVTAEQITGLALGSPIRIDVSNQSKKTLVDIHGRTAMSNLAELWPALIPDFVRGQSSYHTQLVISEPEPGNFGVSANIESDLVGVKVDSPAPLGKTQQEEKRFKLRIDEHAKTGLSYQLTYQDWLHGWFGYTNDDHIGGQIALGEMVTQRDPSQFSVVGHLQQLDADAWLAWQSQQVGNNAGYQHYLDSIDVNVNQLTLFEQHFDDVGVRVLPRQKLWDIALSAKQFKGNIQLPDGGDVLEPVQANFDFVHLTLPSSDNQENDQTASMALWPAMNVTIAKFQLDEIELGQLKLDAVRTPEQWQLTNATLSSDLYSAEATGVWRKQANQENSQFQVTTKSNNLKKLLAHFGYQQVIEAKKVVMDSNLSWPSHPLAISRNAIQGELNIDVGRGQLLEVEPGAAGRIFGLLSIAALPRRLVLDFSELFSKGLGFSSIRGQFNFSDGIAETDNLTLLGDSAKIEISGPIDLVEQTYDQIVKITPNVSSTLPLAGAVAGGPVGLGVGAAILLVDKLADRIFDREIVNLISYNYSLSGPWEEPQLQIVAPATN